MGRKEAYAAPVGKKWCQAHDSGHGDYRPLSEFGNNTKKKDGLQVWCRDCWNTYQNEHYHHKAKSAEWRQKVNERIRQRTVKKSNRVSRLYDPNKTYPCTKCKRVLSADHFQQRMRKQGVSLYSQCTDCLRESNTAWVRKNHKRVNELRRIDDRARKILKRMEEAA